uniref:Cellulose biosynthesis protein n=1 Tax=Podoviridae sp. ct8Lf7 TaxID=2827723 RepID=A0A8S5S1B9_9CAUD|nr:MAG TPA: cellulose biosynthesis protein [Podoviridae sp. ct8Lf7]
MNESDFLQMQFLPISIFLILPLLSQKKHLLRQELLPKALKSKYL